MYECAMKDDMMHGIRVSPALLPRIRTLVYPKNYQVKTCSAQWLGDSPSNVKPLNIFCANMMQYAVYAGKGPSDGHW